MLKDKRLAMKKMVLRLMLSLVIGIFAGAVPGAAMISYGAENVAAAQAVVSEAGESDGTMFILCFVGGILLLVLFVSVIAVVVSVSTAGVVGAQEDE